MSLEHLSGGQFDIYKHTDPHESFGDVPGRTYHIALDPHNRSGPMGVLSVNEASPGQPHRSVDEVWVDKQYRRSGPRAPQVPVADALYEAAGRPAHSPDRTSAGDAFARRVGGDVPTRRGADIPGYNGQLEKMMKINATETWRGARNEAIRSETPFPAPPTSKKWY